MSSSVAQKANVADIPVIDISGAESDLEIGKRLVGAAELHGFVYIKNLGKDVPISAIDRSFELVCVQSSHLRLVYPVSPMVIPKSPNYVFLIIH